MPQAVAALFHVSQGTGIVEGLTSVLELSYNQIQPHRSGKSGAGVLFGDPATSDLVGDQRTERTDSEIEENCMNSPAPERDGFQLTSKTFVVPTDTSRLDPALKRKTTICNLFANHHLPIRDIMRVLDEPYATVVGTLIEFGLVYERRHDRQEPVKIERRQTFFRSL